MAWKKWTILKQRNISGVAKHLARMYSVPQATVAPSRMKNRMIYAPKTRYSTTQTRAVTRPVILANRKISSIRFLFFAA